MRPKVEYAALINDTIAHLKETSLSLLSTREEWEALGKIKIQSPPPAPLPPRTQPKPSSSPSAKPAPARVVSQPEQLTKDPLIEKKVEKKAERPAHHNVQHSAKKDDSKIKSFLHRVSFPLSESIPDDAAATRVMKAYKEYVGDVDVIIFACDADPDTLSLIKNLSKSIDQKLGPVKVLRADRFEREELWDLFLSKNPVKLIIASSGFTQLKNAMAYYTRGLEDSPLSFLRGIPLIVLLPCASYAHSPKEKLLLWDQLCAQLKH